MEAAATEKVCRIREFVANRIGESRFRTWFGDSTSFRVNGDELAIRVATPFVQTWINSNFQGDLGHAARSVIGEQATVTVTVAEHGENATKPAPLERAPEAPPVRRRSARENGTIQSLRGELETLVVGPPNHLAYSAARSIVERPGEALRLLVLHGGCGLGKTHVLQGICNGIRRQHPTLAWKYVSGEEFTNAYVYAVKTGGVDAFRARFRKVDVLVIDDIHFLANKRATQEEFLHTFNAIDATGCAIVISSDRHPRAIAPLAEPLLNRLLAGMVVEIEAPDLNMRRAILEHKAASMGARVPQDVIDFIASRVTRNVRALEGALYKLVALCSLTREPLNLDIARRAITDYADSQAAPEPTDVERVVGNYLGVTRDAICGKSRDRTTSLARALTGYLIRKHTSMSFPEIGRALGNKNHTTILMAVRRVEKTLRQEGAVTWMTSSGLREARLRDVLQTLEQDLTPIRRPPA